MITALPIILIIIIVSTIAINRSNRQTAEKSQSGAIEKITGEFYQVIEGCDGLSKDIVINSEIQDILKQTAEGERYPEELNALYYINGFIANRDYVNSVVLTGTNQTILSTEKAFTNITDFNTIEGEEWFEKLQKSPYSHIWIENSDKMDILTENSSDSGVSEDGAYMHRSAYESNQAFDWQPLLMARRIYRDSEKMDLIGYLMIYLDKDYLENILNDTIYGESTNVWLVDKGGKVILDNNPQTDYSGMIPRIIRIDGNKVVHYKGIRFVVGSRNLEGTDWKICMATPYIEIDNSQKIIMIESGGLLLAVIVIMIILTIKTTSSIAKPISQLSDIMDSFHGEVKKHEEVKENQDFDETQYLDRTDEIGQIYRSYKQMSTRMDTMIKEIYLKTIEKRDAELALLQSQINPHFLYNTLDTINWMALANDQDEISDMVTALSDMFRLSLTKSKSSYVELSQELEYVESYFTLQKFKYNERLIYNMETDSQCDGLYVPKFILQPIIENALKHGIDKIDAGGKVDVHIYTDDDCLYVDVWNDGDAIDLEQMSQLMEFDPEHMEYLAFNKKGYGIQNIHRRICILCGIEYGLEYKVENGRTRCRAILPVRREDSNE